MEDSARTLEDLLFAMRALIASWNAGFLLSFLYLLSPGPAAWMVFTDAYAALYDHLYRPQILLGYHLGRYVPDIAFDLLETWSAWWFKFWLHFQINRWKAIDDET